MLIRDGVSAGEPLQPRSCEVHVGYLDPDRLKPRMLSTCRELLDRPELERYQRLGDGVRGRAFLVGRALARTMASRYAPVHPRDWRFEPDPHGKPQVTGPTGFQHVHLNLSNTKGMVVCAVAKQGPVGVDVEDVQRSCRPVEIAGHYFSHEEIRDLNLLSPERRRLRFFEYWTLKESYLKAVGRGLTLPLDQLTFHLEGQPPIRANFGVDIGDDPRAWQFTLHRLFPRHLLALAIRCGKGHTTGVTVEPFAPLIRV